MILKFHCARTRTHKYFLQRRTVKHQAEGTIEHTQSIPFTLFGAKQQRGKVHVKQVVVLKNLTENVPTARRMDYNGIILQYNPPAVNFAPGYAALT